MRMPTPDPVGQYADALRPEIDAAVERGDVNESVNLSVRATFLTAIAIRINCRVFSFLPMLKPPVLKF